MSQIITGKIKMEMKKNFFAYAIFLIFTLILCSCQTVETTEDDGLSEEERIKNEIEILVDAMALPDHSKLDNICNRLISYGEDAIPELSKNIENRITIVRLLCIFCLGQIYENTKSPKILELKPDLIRRLSDPVEKVKLETAGALCMMGEHQGVPFLIDALKNEEPYVRMVAFQILFKTFQITFNYQYNDLAERREESVKQWQEWWMKKVTK